jgi:integrase
MARTVDDAKIGTRNARLRLTARREPYWRAISQGLAIGYRKGKKGGTWIARHYARAQGRRFSPLGAADDIVDADGQHIFSFDQAQEAARRWFADLGQTKARRPYTVKQACDAYVEYLRAERKTGDDSERRLQLYVLPLIGNRLVNDLEKDEIEKVKRCMVKTDPEDPETERRSKDSANRVMSMLKAALNRAFADDSKRIANDAAWRRVKPFRGVTRARQAHLNIAQSLHLINVCDGALKRLVTAALLTGARPPHELVTLRVRDFRADLGILSIVDGKTGPRDITVTAEAVRFFEEIAAGRESDELLLPKDDGSKWGQNHHLRPMRDAVAKAKLPKDCTIYTLRHTHASQSILAGYEPETVSGEHGHVDPHARSTLWKVHRRVATQARGRVSLQARAKSRQCEGVPTED